jgi:hypothetical protein
MAITADDVRGMLTGTGQVSGTGTAADLSDTAIGREIELARLYVAGRLGSVPDHPLVDQVVGAVAAYHCTLTYREGVDLTEADPVALRYTWARGVLTEATSGALNFAPAAGEPAPAGPADSGVINPYTGDLFTADDFGIKGA